MKAVKPFMPIWTLLLIFPLLACSTVSVESAETTTPDEVLLERGLRIAGEVDAIENMNLRSWSYVDSFHLTLRDGATTHYLVELRTPCPNMRFTRALATSSPSNRLTRQDRIIIQNSAGTLDRCDIQDIFRLEAVNDKATAQR